MWKSKWLKEWQFVQRHIWHTGCVPKAWKQKSSSLVGSSNGGSVGPQLELGAQEDHKPPVNNVSSSWHSPRQNPVKNDYDTVTICSGHLFWFYSRTSTQSMVAMYREIWLLSQSHRTWSDLSTLFNILLSFCILSHSPVYPFSWTTLFSFIRGAFKTKSRGCLGI